MHTHPEHSYQEQHVRQKSSSLERIEVLSRPHQDPLLPLPLLPPTQDQDSDAFPLKTALKSPNPPDNSRNEPKQATFNLEPEYIPPRRVEEGEGEEWGEEVGLEDLSESQLRELKEQSQRKVRRIVAAVGITLTLISIILVALSLTLGQKIGDHLKQNAKNQAEDSNGQLGKGRDYYLGPLEERDRRFTIQTPRS